MALESKLIEFNFNIFATTLADTINSTAQNSIIFCDNQKVCLPLYDISIETPSVSVHSKWKMEDEINSSRLNQT